MWLCTASMSSFSSPHSSAFFMHKYNICQQRHSIYKQSYHVPLHVIIHLCLAPFLSSSSAWFILSLIWTWLSRFSLHRPRDSSSLVFRRDSLSIALTCTPELRSIRPDSLFNVVIHCLPYFVVILSPSYWCVHQSYAQFVATLSSSSILVPCKPELCSIRPDLLFITYFSLQLRIIWFLIHRYPPSHFT